MDLRPGCCRGVRCRPETCEARHSESAHGRRHAGPRSVRAGAGLSATLRRRRVSRPLYFLSLVKARDEPGLLAGGRGRSLIFLCGYGPFCTKLNDLFQVIPYSSWAPASRYRTEQPSRRFLAPRSDFLSSVLAQGKAGWPCPRQGRLVLREGLEGRRPPRSAGADRLPPPSPMCTCTCAHISSCGGVCVSRRHCFPPRRSLCACGRRQGGAANRATARRR